MEFAQWYFSSGWLILTIIGSFVGWFSSLLRAWWILYAWLALVLVLGVIAIVLKG